MKKYAYYSWRCAKWLGNKEKGQYDKPSNLYNMSIFQK